jgi:hypothetical protein
MVFEQMTPDGRTLVMAWLEECETWRAKFADESVVRQGDTAAEAIAAVSGEPEDVGWIVTMAHQVETVLALERQVA